jgi:hypothetical protein
MNKRRMTVAGALLSIVTGAASFAAAKDDVDLGLCPIERAGARIARINPSSAKARLKRNGNVAMISEGQCLLFGDRIEADAAAVDIQTATELIYIGRGHERRHYVVPSPATRARHVSPSQAAQVFFNQLFRDGRSPTPGVGRGSTSECKFDRNDPPPPVRPLARVSPGHQKVGTDVEQLLVVWTKGPTRQGVSVSLRSTEGKLIHETRICGAGRVSVTLARNVRRAGGSMVLTVSGDVPPELQWTIEWVDPQSLPASSAATGWMLGAERAIEGTPDLQLDALSRLATAENDYLAARWILADALASKE